MTTSFLSRRERRVFFDSSGYLAMLDERDSNHGVAAQMALAIGSAGYRQVTTNVMLIEAHALFLARVGIQAATEFLLSTLAGSTVIVRVRASDEQRAISILTRYRDKDFSFADAISFAVMERLGITRAFTFDRHFAQYGWTALTPDQLGA